jgi:glycosyltransferase involved in cell wall biosynthesis
MRGWLYNYVESSVLRRARHVILISPYVAEWLQPWSRARTYAIENPVDERFFSLDSREDAGGGVLFVGNLSPRKGLFHLLRAFARVAQAQPKARLTIVGKAREEAFLARLKAEAHSLGLAEKVEFTGQVAEERLLALYRACDVLALPSVEETSPVVIAQAMAAGKPVVATRVGGVPYMVHEGETGYLVEYGDDDTLAERLIRLLGDATLCRRMGKAARKEARARFALAGVAQRTLTAYRTVLGREP